MRSPGNLEREDFGKAGGTIEMKIEKQQGLIKSGKQKAQDVVITAVAILISITCLLPMVNLLARSLSSSQALVRHEVYLWPVGTNLEAYGYVLGDSSYIRAFGWTVLLTVTFTLLALTMTTLCAYPLIFKELKGRGTINILITITMFFNAGTIPNYLLFQKIGLLNHPLVLLLPTCLSVFNMIIMRNFLYGIPVSLCESAQIDGASYATILWKIYLPVSKPVLATLTLFYAVERWNGYSDALMYMNDDKYYPLQLLLYNILNNINRVEIATQQGFSAPGLSDSLKAAIVMFSTIPILLIYPWLQKYFIHGVMVGAVKE